MAMSHCLFEPPILVDTSNSRPRGTHCPTAGGEPDDHSLWGKTPTCWKNRASYLAAERLIGKLNKDKFRDVDTPDAKLAPTEESAGLNLSEDAFYDQPKTQSGGQPSNIVNCGAVAGHPVSIGISPAAGKGNTDHDVDYDAVLQHDVSVVVATPPHDDEKKDDDDPTCDDDDDDDDYDPKQDPPIAWLDVEDIEADWLERFISIEYGMGIGTERNQKFAYQIFWLLVVDSESGLERLMLPKTRCPESVTLPMSLMLNRWKIIWCIRLARAENQVERKKIEKEMRPLLHLILLF